MPFHCASLFSSIYPCVRAFSNVMMSFYVHNRQLLVYLFCIASPAEVFDSCSLLHWHRVIQLGGDNRVKHGVKSFLYEGSVVGRTLRRSIPSSNPGFFTLSCEQGDEYSWYVCQI